MSIDTRTPAEIAYDNLKDGSAYTKPSVNDDTLVQIVQELIRVQEAGHDKIAPTETLQITRHTHHTDGTPAGDPWTTYKLGEAEIDIQDAGGVSLYIGRESIEIDENAQLLDLAMLLADERVLNALDPTNDEYTPCSPVWEAVLDITTDPTNDGSAEEVEEEVEEYQPVPPVPAGYPTDRAMIYKSYGDVFIAIDRRDGETVICEKDKNAGEDNAIIISPAYALALVKFFDEKPIKELMWFHRTQAMRATGSPELLSLLDWVDSHLGITPGGD
jgi:hypothetical protein